MHRSPSFRVLLTYLPTGQAYISSADTGFSTSAAPFTVFRERLGRASTAPCSGATEVSPAAHLYRLLHDHRGGPAGVPPPCYRKVRPFVGSRSSPCHCARAWRGSEKKWPALSRRPLFKNCLQASEVFSGNHP